MSDLHDLLELAYGKRSVRMATLPDTMHDAFMLAYHRGLIRAYVPLVDYMSRRNPAAPPDNPDPRVLWANRNAKDTFVDAFGTAVTSPVMEITDAGLAYLAEANAPPADDHDDAQSPWSPPTGYVGVKNVGNDARFRKNGKNPPRTTIADWLNTHPTDKVKAPDTQEVHVPEAWVFDRIREWNPRP